MTKRYLLYGLGIANQAVLHYLQKHGASVKVFCDGDSDALDVLDECDVIIKSPGIKPDALLLIEARKRKIEIIGDLESFYQLRPNLPIICVTGTNGKTTTCRLLYEILKNKYRVLLAGNIGIPLFSVIEEKDIDLIIIEASSYMLDDCITFHPHIVAILNLFPNHLDHHHSFLEYANAKHRALINMTEKDFYYYNGSDPILAQWAKQTEAQCIDFLQYLPLSEELSSISRALIGQHNKVNLALCMAIAFDLGLSIDEIKKAISQFNLPPYRLEKVYDDGQLVIYNDSKSTNPLASKVALEALKNQDKLIWIAGGKKRGDDYDLLTEVLHYVSEVYLYGENVSEFLKIIEKSTIPYQVYQTLEEVVKALKHHHDFGTILFSPGAQSYDQFISFEERGTYFNNLINQYFNLHS